MTSTEYYAARAALQIGLIHEEKKNFSKAQEFYQKCIDLEGHDFENSLEQKETSGIERCMIKQKTTKFEKRVKDTKLQAINTTLILQNEKTGHIDVIRTVGNNGSACSVR